MRKLLSAFAALAVVVTLPTVADAQRRAASSQPRMHEFGIDLGLAWYNESYEDEGESGIRLGTPLDLRVGFPSRGKMMFEGRLGLGFDSKGGFNEDGDPASSYTFTPGVNVLYSARGAHRSGMYMTGGAGMNMLNGGELGGMGFALNAAVGWRKPWNNGGAIRYELGIRWDSEISDEFDPPGGGGVQDFVVQPTTLSIGARVGLSMWH